MAISFLQEVSGIYPAYNDSFVKLKSDIEESYKLEIVASPSNLFSRSFEVFPDLDGEYLFNIKEVVKVVFNQNGFNPEELEQDVFFGSIEGVYLSQLLTFRIHYKRGAEEDFTVVDGHLNSDDRAISDKGVLKSAIGYQRTSVTNLPFMYRVVDGFGLRYSGEIDIEGLAGVSYFDIDGFFISSEATELKIYDRKELSVPDNAVYLGVCSKGKPIIELERFSESEEKKFEFYKGVKQVGDFISENEQRVLTYSENGVDNNVTYFQGFPFSFSVLKVKANSVLSVKNKNTTDKTKDVLVYKTGAFKCVVDDGVYNWTNNEVLPLIAGLNKLELIIDDSFKSNINIKKKIRSCGVYLRWFNSEGGFSYYLFNEYYRNIYKSKGLGRVYDVDFKNIGDSVGNSRSKGKETFRSKRVKANFDTDEYGVLEGVLSSPFVQMYTSEKAFVKGRFIDVDVEGDLIYNNKRNKNEIDLTIKLTNSININL